MRRRTAKGEYVAWSVALPGPAQYFASSGGEPQIHRLERAFEIAQSGVSVNIGDIRDRLKAEGYDQNQFNGSNNP